jgi:hypothetical protein
VNILQPWRKNQQIGGSLVCFEECVVVVVLLLLLMTSTNNQAGGVNIFLARSWASLAVTSA